MKLFHSPGACSLASHIVALEAGLDIDLDRVDITTRRTQEGHDYSVVNPKGYVPALMLANGHVITEGAVIMQFLADRNPVAGLLPPQGTLERYAAQEMLSFIATELHQPHLPMFAPECSAAQREAAWARLSRRYTLIDSMLVQRDYLCGTRFGAADAYLFVMTCWSTRLGFSLEAYPAVQAHMQRVAARPAVVRAMQREGLIPSPRAEAA